jgi:uncharacterized protein HemY
MESWSVTTSLIVLVLVLVLSYLVEQAIARLL